MAHLVLEAQKFHSLPATRKTDGVTQSEPKGLRTREANDVNLSPKAGEDFSVRAVRKKKRKKKEFLPLPFVLFSTLRNWVMSTHCRIAEGNLLY
jgi:hypothetical protein